ncbi:MAG: hypothetical protein IJY22_02490 [Clostridia bacterium]|nr:hypothetical protein [Clostridia bacterium]
MKKTLSLLLAITLCLSLSVLFTACGHEHEYATDWSKDDTHHWHACTGKDCTEIADKAEHSFETSNTCVCGAVKPVVTTVETDEAWASAFDLGTNWTIHAVATASGITAMEVLAQRNGNKFTKDEGNNHDAYDAVKDNNCYTYRACYNGDNEFVGYTETDVTSRYTVEVFTALWSQTYISSAMFGNRADFTYNEDTQKYEAASLLDGSATNAWVSFEDGKIVAVGYDMAMSPSSAATCVITVTYGTAGEITLPTNIVTP